MLNINFPLRIVFLSVFMMSVTLPLRGQNPTIDSLTDLLSKKGVDRTSVLIELAKQNNIDGNYEKALALSTEAIGLALSEGDSLKIVMAYRFKAAALRRMEKYDESLSIIKKINSIAERNNFTSERKYLLNSMAIIYSHKVRYDLALDCNFKSLAIREAEGNKSEISIALNNIGYVYSSLKNSKKALEFFNKSIEMKRASGDNYDLERVLINIGLSEVQLEKFNDAIQHINEAISICGSNCNNDIKMEALFGLAVANFNLNNLVEAQELFNKSYDLAKTNDSQLNQSRNLIYLARISMQKKQFNVTLAHLKLAEQIAKETGYNDELIDIYKYSLQLYTLRKDTKNELIYKDKYFKLNDSLISVDLARNITTIQSEFEEMENFKTIDQKDEIIKLGEVTVTKFRKEYFFILSISLLCVIVTVILIRLSGKNNIKRKENIV